MLACLLALDVARLLPHAGCRRSARGRAVEPPIERRSRARARRTDTRAARARNQAREFAIGVSGCRRPELPRVRRSRPPVPALERRRDARILAAAPAVVLSNHGLRRVRGYFAKRTQSPQRAGCGAGDDVSVGGVPTYSTLGHLRDPVFSTMLGWRESRLVSTMFQRWRTSSSTCAATARSTRRTRQ